MWEKEARSKPPAPATQAPRPAPAQPSSTQQPQGVMAAITQACAAAGCPSVQLKLCSAPRMLCLSDGLHAPSRCGRSRHGQQLIDCARYSMVPAHWWLRRCHVCRSWPAPTQVPVQLHGSHQLIKVAIMQTCAAANALLMHTLLGWQASLASYMLTRAGCKQLLSRCWRRHLHALHAHFSGAQQGPRLLLHDLARFSHTKLAHAGRAVCCTCCE